MYLNMSLKPVSNQSKDFLDAVEITLTMSNLDEFWPENAYLVDDREDKTLKQKTTVICH